MALADTILAVIGDTAAVTAAVFAYGALRQARETVSEAKAARLDAEEAAREAATERRSAAEDRHEAAMDRREAAADRRQEEQDRQRRRMERVAEMVEDLFWAADLARRGSKVEADYWMRKRNLLGLALVGLHNRLPEAASLLNCATVDQAFGPASHARQEIERELNRLGEQPT